MTIGQLQTVIKKLKLFVYDFLIKSHISDAYGLSVFMNVPRSLKDLYYTLQTSYMYFNITSIFFRNSVDKYYSYLMFRLTTYERICKLTYIFNDFLAFQYLNTFYVNARIVNV